MYDNIGGKIKGLAKAIVIIVAIAAAITGFALMISNDDMILAGLLIMIVAPLVAWISSWLLYGFGQLIENSDKLVEINEERFYLQRNSNLQPEVKHSDKKWKCEKCGSLITADLDHCPICEFMNKEGN